MAKQITIIGMGRMGIALARAVRTGLPGLMLVAADPDAATRARAQAQGLAHHVTGNLSGSVQNSDLVVLAAPLEDYAALAQEFGPALKAGSLFMDTAPVKQKAFSLISPWIPESVAFIPADPLVDGDEDIRWAPGARCVLTPPSNAPLKAIEAATSFWEALGFQIEIMPLMTHDMTMAMARQMPALMAAVQMFSSLGETQKSGVMDVLQYAGEALPLAFLRKQDPLYWRAAVLANRLEIEKFLGEIVTALEALQKAVRRGDAELLLQLFTDARDVARGPGWDQGKKD